MVAFLSRRLIEMIPVVILVTAVSFALIFVLPGDPATYGIEVGVSF